MSNPDAPTNHRDAMILAREATPVDIDTRDDFDVYLDTAKKVVPRQLNNALGNLPVSTARKEEILTAEAYSLAQASHLEDTGGETSDPE